MLMQLQLHEDELHTDECYSGIVLGVNACNYYEFRSCFYSFL
jgi:hypothetical protein